VAGWKEIFSEEIQIDYLRRVPIEGNKRAIALGKLRKIVGLEVFCGISPSIKDYLWARYSHE